MIKRVLNNMFKEEEVNRRVVRVEVKESNRYLLYDILGRKYYGFSDTNYTSGAWVFLEGDQIVGSTTKPSQPIVYEV